jgi:hypothetical protein
MAQALASAAVGLVLMVQILPGPARADTLYLCKSYSGGHFWSDRPCAERQALIDRMVSVPAGMPFDQQVKLGEQARAEGERLSRPPTNAAATTPPARNPGATRPKPAPTRDECTRLAERLDHLDAQARQPQSGEKQDKLLAQKRKLQARQARAGC